MLMKTYVKYGVSLLTLMSVVSPVFAAEEDTQIEDALNAENTKKITSEAFSMKKFNSCESFEKVTSEYFKKYYKNSPPIYYRGGIQIDTLSLESEPAALADDAWVSEKSSVAGSAGSDFSSTNVQVSGVDESDIIKTDGEYIYYMADYYDQELVTSNYKDRQNKYVFIINAQTMQVVKKLALPDHFLGTQIYVKWDRLVVLASGHPTSEFQRRYWDSSTKTYTVIFDIANPRKAELLKAFVSEGNFSKSRLIDDKLYVISRKDAYNYYRPYFLEGTSQPEDDFSAEDIVPKGLEIYKTSDISAQNVEVKWKKLPYNVTSGYVSKCDEIEYILPENDETGGFPSFNLVSTIDIEDISKSADTKVIFGDLREIYMNHENLYITNSFYKTTPFSCPADAFCIRPFYYGGTNHTLIHKLGIEDEGIEYKTSTLIPGQALTQYSMDEHNGYFRILTQKYQPERSTGLYILDTDLKLTSSLTGLWETEDFKSSRFIGDKLFLVTFEQVDPLFAIDVADPENPKVLGELKIPGYSTYLHPYDENHLIGLGYDTAQNKWWGTINNGVKVDVYQINYDKKCGDADLTAEEKSKCDEGDYRWIIVKQLHSYTMGENGSYSEALNNPRMFVWNAAKKLLLLPVNLYKNDTEDIYKRTDFFSGLVGLSVDKDAGVSEKYRITHITKWDLEEKRKLECAKYSQTEENQCKKLVDGSTYCGPKKYTYIPNYCYADSTVEEYFAAKSWNYSNYFMKRALWIGDTTYAISDKKLSSHDIDTGVQNNIIDLK